MADRQIHHVLPRMFTNGDPRLNQYLAAIYERGFSLRTIAEVAGCSYETVRLRIIKADEEQGMGEIYDLSGLPAVTVIPKQPIHRAPYFISEDTKKMLRAANDTAKGYRRGQDPAFAQAFNMMVNELVGQGVPFAAIAKACGQPERNLRRRMARWGVNPSRRSRRVPPRRLDENLPTAVIGEHVEQETAVKVQKRRKVQPGQQVCRWPDCPSHFVGGQPCIHI